MSDTATIAGKLSSAQSELVHELHNALTDFNSANALSKEKHWNVVTKFIELQMEFPEMAALAKSYYEAVEAPYVTEPKLDGYNESLFWLLLSLRAFAGATNLEEFNRVTPFLQQYLDEFASFSRGYYPVQVIVPLVGIELPGER